MGIYINYAEVRKVRELNSNRKIVTGQTVVFIHGWTNNWTTWIPVERQSKVAEYINLFIENDR